MIFKKEIQKVSMNTLRRNSMHSLRLLQNPLDIMNLKEKI